MTSAPVIRRAPHKQVRDVAAFHALLDAALVAHVGVVDDGRPLVIPLAFVRDGDHLLVHGSTGSRAFRRLAEGVPTCATVTIADGVVVAMSQFESSMHYRSAMILGAFTRLEGEQKDAAFAAVAAGLLPGVQGQRTPTRKESAATSVLALPLDEWSLKVSDGPPGDLPEDLGRPVWAGVVPLRHVWGQPVDAPHLTAGQSAPAVLRDWPEGRA